MSRLDNLLFVASSHNQAIFWSRMEPNPISSLGADTCNPFAPFESSSVVVHWSRLRVPAGLPLIHYHELLRPRLEHHDRECRRDKRARTPRVGNCMFPAHRRRWVRPPPVDLAVGSDSEQRRLAYGRSDDDNEAVRRLNVQFPRHTCHTSCTNIGIREMSEGRGVMAQSDSKLWAWRLQPGSRSSSHLAYKYRDRVLVELIK